MPGSTQLREKITEQQRAETAALLDGDQVVRLLVRAKYRRKSTSEYLLVI
jgi:hypothetical protein